MPDFWLPNVSSALFHKQKTTPDNNIDVVITRPKTTPRSAYLLNSFTSEYFCILFARGKHNHTCKSDKLNGSSRLNVLP